MMKSLLILSALVFSSFAMASGGGEHFKPLYPPPVADTSKSTRPEKPELLEPKALADVSGTSTTLTWKAAPGATSYHVQVATDSNFKWLVVDKYDVTATEFQVGDLKSGQHYFWRVYGVKADNISQFTNGFPAWSSFSVK